MKRNDSIDVTVQADVRYTGPLRKDSLLVFYRTIAALLDSGRTVTQAFEVAAKNSIDENMQAAAYGVFDAMALEGKTLGDAIRRYPNMFNDLNKGLIETGEQIGALSKVFPKIADAEEALDVTRHRIQNALLYPGIILTGILILMTVLPRLFIPAVRRFASDLDVAMPAFSKLVFGFSDLTASPYFWGILLAGAVAVKTQWSNVFRSEPIQRRLFAFCYRVPALAVVVRAVSQAHWARILSLQLEAGTTADRALANIKLSLRDPVFREACQTMIDALQGGKTIAQGMEQANYFDAIMVGSVAVGEETGSLPRLLDFLARSYDQELSLRVSTFEQLITPALLLLCGLIVGVWAVAVLLPLGQVLANLGV
jgi:type II secretory pathway component PulF